MSDYDRGFPRSAPAGTADMAVDAGLRGYMLGIYNKLALGLVLAGLVAWAVGNVPAASQLIMRIVDDRPVGFTPLGWLVVFAPLGLILARNFFMKRATPASSAFIYWAVVATVGASLGVLFFVYSGASIASTFLITATAFGALSLFGYTTKKDLTGLGTFLFMGLFGLIAAALVSFFVGGLYSNPGFYFIFNALGVFIFAGLIAWKTQYLKLNYYAWGGDQASLAVATNDGALTLFISFVNLFRFILAFTGGSRR
jgi:FtsH-binding integral membrane protein